MPHINSSDIAQQNKHVFKNICIVVKCSDSSVTVISKKMFDLILAS